MNNQDESSNFGPGASGLAVQPKQASLAQKVLIKNQNALSINPNPADAGSRFESFGGSGNIRNGTGPGGYAIDDQQQQQQQIIRPAKPATLPKPILVRPQANAQPESANARYNTNYDGRFQQAGGNGGQSYSQQTVHTTRFDRTPIQAPAVRTKELFLVSLL